MLYGYWNFFHFQQHMLIKTTPMIQNVILLHVLIAFIIERPVSLFICFGNKPLSTAFQVQGLADEALSTVLLH